MHSLSDAASTSPRGTRQATIRDPNKYFPWDAFSTSRDAHWVVQRLLRNDPHRVPPYIPHVTYTSLKTHVQSPQRRNRAPGGGVHVSVLDVPSCTTVNRPFLPRISSSVVRTQKKYRKSQQSILSRTSITSEPSKATRRIEHLNMASKVPSKEKTVGDTPVDSSSLGKPLRRAAALTNLADELGRARRWERTRRLRSSRRHERRRT